MRAAINCALSNRQILTHLTRRAFRAVYPGARLALLYDVSHNTCKIEEHVVAGRTRRLYVHRKGATRAFGPGHPELPPVFLVVSGGHTVLYTVRPQSANGDAGQFDYGRIGQTRHDAARESSDKVPGVTMRTTSRRASALAPRLRASAGSSTWSATATRKPWRMSRAR